MSTPIDETGIDFFAQYFPNYTPKLIKNAKRLKQFKMRMREIKVKNILHYFRASASRANWLIALPNIAMIRHPNFTPSPSPRPSPSPVPRPLIARLPIRQLTSPERLMKLHKLYHKIRRRRRRIKGKPIYRRRRRY